MKQKAIIYGIGKDFFKYESELKEKYDVVCLVDGDPSRMGKLHGVPYVKKSDFITMDYDVVVVVPAYHKMEIIQDIRTLGIPDSKIVPYIPFQSNMVPEISLKLGEKLCHVTCGKIKFMLKHSSDFGVLNQVYAHTEYGLKVAKRLTVIDVGMNIGLTSLYFASMDNVHKVYGYEPFPETYCQAIENFSLNDLEVKNKITAYKAGWGNKNARLKINEYSQDFSWGMRTDNLEITEVVDDACSVEILKADEELRRIISECPEDILVLKLDCEGAEYDILSVLEDANLLKEINIILMETHDFRGNIAVDFLYNNNFTVFHQFLGTAEGLGMAYAIRQK